MKMKNTGKIARCSTLSALCCLLLLGSARLCAGGEALHLTNGSIDAGFGPRGLERLTHRALDLEIKFAKDEFALTIDGNTIDGESLDPLSTEKGETTVTYSFVSSPHSIKVIYELMPDRLFITKRIELSAPENAVYTVNGVTALRSVIDTPIVGNPVLIGRPNFPSAFASFFRFSGPDKDEAPTFGGFFTVQNPFLDLQRDEQNVTMTYAPKMEWKSEYGDFKTDRVCIGIYRLTGDTFPTEMVSEWKYVPAGETWGTEYRRLDAADSFALSDCVRAFLLENRKKSLRVHVAWCENDYQIDVATPEGVEEYKRIVDCAAELGCRYMLYGPANSELSDPNQNTDTWKMEHLLWFGLGQKIRRNEWRSESDPIPDSLQLMLDYAKEKNVKLIAYVFPSLGFKQDPKWTTWPGSESEGYMDANTGYRSFQDWLTAEMISFQRKTHAGGFSFDYWWLHRDAVFSEYSQWYGCRRILESLRAEIPDVVIDGRQTYNLYGPWSWTAGSYPHPLAADEQPTSFYSFPDLHVDRVFADRQRYTAWWYRMLRFCPVEVLPGFISHQTTRVDDKGILRRDGFRRRDWDYLGLRYSVLSSIATGPFNHVVNMIPARDPEEFRAFSEEDKQWFRKWLDWTDLNIEYMRRLRPIIGQPMIGRVDGTSAIIDDRGYVFLFNPNYRRLPAQFVLNDSIGLTKGDKFLIKEMYPQEGRLIGNPSSGLWSYGDTFTVEMTGAEATVLEIAPSPKDCTEPILFNVSGKATLENGALNLSEVSGEAGREYEVAVLIPQNTKIDSVGVNGVQTAFDKNGDLVRSTVRFAGVQFGRCRQIGEYDPNFTGGTFTGTFSVPKRVLIQLRNRKKQWPVPYGEDDTAATWLAPSRLLLFAQIAEPNINMTASLTLNGVPFEIKRAHSDIYGRSQVTFLGFYADLSLIRPDKEYKVELTLPDLEPGRFQGLFFENVETEYTTEVIGSDVETNP